MSMIYDKRRDAIVHPHNWHLFDLSGNVVVYVYNNAVDFLQ